jgi:flagellar assembly protein FliH
VDGVEDFCAGGDEMSSKRIPKELMTPYQRWEMASFAEDRSPPIEIAPEPEIVVPPPPAISAEEIAEIREQARSEGHAEGTQQGYAEGYAKGTRAAFEIGQQENIKVLQQLREVAVGFTTQIAASGETVAPQLLELALDVAKAMLKTALPARPELVLPLISAAMHALPSMQLPASLHVHPDDAALVRQHIGEEMSGNGWLIVADDDIERGSCRIETPGNQIDGSSVTRWRRIAASLSQDSDWLAP